MNLMAHSYFDIKNNLNITTESKHEGFSFTQACDLNFRLKPKHLHYDL